MHKSIKWLLAYAIFLFTALIITLFVITATNDPNDYRDQITSAVKEQTGADLTIDNIDWSIFPWLGLSIGETKLSEPSVGALATLNSVKVKVKLFPLLSKKIEIGDIELLGTSIYVVQEADGSLNWDVLAGASEETPPTEPTNDESSGETPDIDITIQSINIADAMLHYHDKSSGSKIKIEKLYFTAKDLTVNSAQPVTTFPIQMSLSFSDNQGTAIDPKLSAQVAIDLPKQQFQLNDVVLNIAAQVPDIPRKLEARLAASLSADLENNRAAIDNLKLTFDDSTLTGYVKVTDINTQAIQSELTLDQLNVDQYLPPATEDDAKAETEDQPEASTTASSGDEQLIPVDTLKGIDIDATLNINQLQASNIKTDNIVIKALGKNGLLSLRSFKGNTLGGSFLLSADVDVRGKTPKLAFKKDLDKIDIEPALKAVAGSDLMAGILFFGGDLATQGNSVNEWTRNLTGTSEFKLDEGLMRGLNFTELAFEKLGQLGPLVQTFLTEETKQKAPPAFKKDSEIKQLLANIEFDRGVAKTNNLSLSLNDSTANGSASYDMVEHHLDFTLNLQLSESISNPYLANVAWPIRCQGPITATPKCAIDTKPARRYLEKLAKEKAKAEAEKALADKLKEQGIDLGGQSVEQAAKSELKAKEKEKKDEVKAKLREKEDEAKKKLEDALGDKLKGLF